MLEWDFFIACCGFEGVVSGEEVLDLDGVILEVLNGFLWDVGMWAGGDAVFGVVLPGSGALDFEIVGERGAPVGIVLVFQNGFLNATLGDFPDFSALGGVVPDDDRPEVIDLPVVFVFGVCLGALAPIPGIALRFGAALFVMDPLAPAHDRPVHQADMSGLAGGDFEVARV